MIKTSCNSERMFLEQLLSASEFLGQSLGALPRRNSGLTPSPTSRVGDYGCGWDPVDHSRATAWGQVNCTRLVHRASFSEIDEMQSTVATATASPCTRAEAKAELSASEPDSSPFFWSYTEEPHRTRRQAIIKAHPEVKHRGLVQSLILTRFRSRSCADRSL